MYIKSILMAAAILFTMPSAFATDIVEGTVLAFDRKANVIVLDDNSVWSLKVLETGLPDDLKAGDRIEIRYESNEDDGLETIHSIKILLKT